MPSRPPVACAHPGCGDFATKRGRCDRHQVSGWGVDKRSRHERGYGALWDKLRKRILARDKGLCQECLRHGRLTPGNHVDHIVAKALGGTDDDGNLQTLCVKCHRTKSAHEGVAAKGGRY